MKKLIRPMLATLVNKPFNCPDWINQEKYDGFRALVYREREKVRLYSRNLCFSPRNTAFTLFLCEILFDIIETVNQTGSSKFQIP